MIRKSKLTGNTASDFTPIRQVDKKRPRLVTFISKRLNYLNTETNDF